MADVFISYSRRDKEFVKVLHQALSESQYDAWIDWEDIPITADWWEEIQTGIEAADTFIFVISPDSVSSKVCGEEIDYAVANNKRLLPIVRREGFDLDKVRPVLSRHNWLFFREEDDFNQAFQTLVRALDTDLNHIKQHTRLLVKAIEWDKKNRNPSFLLRGDDLQEAEHWIAQGASKQPQPTELHGEYINTSRKAEVERQRAEIKRQRLFTAGIGVFACLALGTAVLAFLKQKEAERGRLNAEIIAQNLTSENLLDADLRMDALIEAMKSGQELKQMGKDADSELSVQTVSSLQQAFYGIYEQNSLRGHSGAVYRVVFSPDGRMLASASPDQTVKLWTIDGKLLKTLKGHSSYVQDVSFSPDGKTIASASSDRTVKLWSIDGKLLKTLRGHSSYVYGVSFSPDGKTLASASDDKTIKLWSMDGKPLKTLKGHSNSINGVSFSPDSKTLASASGDKTVRLWRCADGKLLKIFKGHSDYVRAVSFSPNGKTLASAGDDMTVRLWSINGKLLKTLTGHTSYVYRVSFSPDGQTLASASWDQTVKLWSVDGRLLNTLTGHSNTYVNDVSFSPDGKTLASASADQTIKLWGINGKQQETLRGHTSYVYKVSFSPDGKTLASASADQTIKLWSVEGKLLKTLSVENLKTKADNHYFYDVSFSPDGKMLAAASADGAIRLWRISGELVQTVKAHSSWINSVSFSPDGRMIASASADGTIKLWNLDGKLLKTLKGHSNYVNGVSFSPDGKTLASASGDKTVKLWSIDGTLLKTFKGHSDYVRNVKFSPDGTLLASTSEDRTIKLWSIHGELLKTLKGHSSRVYDVSFSPDGKTLASASADGTIKLWSIDGRLLKTLKGHTSYVNGVSFSPDGKTFASASADGTVKLWNLDLDSLLAESCNWLNNYLITNPENLETLKICQTPANQAAAVETLINDADQEAQTGNLEQALASLTKAFQWNPKLEIDRKEKEGQLTAQSYYAEGTELGNSNQFKAAFTKYLEAQKLNSTIISANDWDNLCWYGSLEQQANDVMEACEKAVEMDPNNRYFQDSRGLARALTGNTEGAIADFQAFIKWSDASTKEKSRRQRWMNELREGKNPFTPQELKALSEE